MLKNGFVYCENAAIFYFSNGTAHRRTVSFDLGLFSLDRRRIGQCDR